MKAVTRFEEGKYYQFVGFPLTFNKGDSPLEKAGASFPGLEQYDIEIKCWMDRQIRLCTKSFGVIAAFDDMYAKHPNGRVVPWIGPRSYRAYLRAGMFQEVEVA